MKTVSAATVTTAGTREIGHRLAEFIKRAEAGEVIDICDQRGRDRRHRAYIVAALPGTTEPEALAEAGA
jgi:hypothetical protein